MDAGYCLYVHIFMKNIKSLNNVMLQLIIFEIFAVKWPKIWNFWGSLGATAPKRKDWYISSHKISCQFVSPLPRYLLATKNTKQMIYQSKCILALCLLIINWIKAIIYWNFCNNNYWMIMKVMFNCVVSLIQILYKKNDGAKISQGLVFTTRVVDLVCLCIVKR